MLFDKIAYMFPRDEREQKSLSARNATLRTSDKKNYLKYYFKLHSVVAIKRPRKSKKWKFPGNAKNS